MIYLRVVYIYNQTDGFDTLVLLATWFVGTPSLKMARPVGLQIACFDHFSAVEREATPTEYEKHESSIDEIKEKEKSEFNWIGDIAELIKENSLKSASIEELIAALKDKGVSVEISKTKVD